MIPLAMALSVAAVVTRATASSPLSAATKLRFNITIPASSGLFEWGPTGQLGGVGPGIVEWQTSFPGQPANYSSTTIAADPVSFHSDSQSYSIDTASVSLNFPMEAVYWNASFTPWNGTDSDALRLMTPGVQETDDEARLSAPGFIRYADGMDTFAAQSAKLAIRSDIQGGGNFTVNSATVTMSIISSAKDWATAWTARQAQPLYNRDGLSYAANAMSCTGDGNEVTDLMKPLEHKTYDQNALGQQGDQALEWPANSSISCVIRIPANQALAMLSGTVGLDYDGMMLQWDPPLPQGMESLNTVSKLSTQTRYQQPSQLLMLQPLDPRQSYNLTVKGKPGFQPTQGLGLISLSILTLFPATPDGTAINYGTGGGGDASTVRKASNNMPAIIGGAVGGVLGALCIAALAIWLWIQHRRKQAALNTSLPHGKSEFDIDDPNVTPFVAGGERPRRVSTDMTTSDGPSSPTFSRGLTGVDTASQGWSDDELLHPHSATHEYFSAASSASSAKSPPPSSTRPARPPMARREVISEQDAGTLEPIVDQVEYEFVPPMYNPEWAQPSTDGLSATSDSLRGLPTPSRSHFSDEGYDTATSTPGTPMLTPGFEETDPMSPVPFSASTYLSPHSDPSATR